MPCCASWPRPHASPCAGSAGERAPCEAAAHVTSACLEGPVAVLAVQTLRRPHRGRFRLLCSRRPRTGPITAREGLRVPQCTARGSRARAAAGDLPAGLAPRTGGDPPAARGACDDGGRPHGRRHPVRTGQRMAQRRGAPVEPRPGSRTALPLILLSRDTPFWAKRRQAADARVHPGRHSGSRAIGALAARGCRPGAIVPAHPSNTSAEGGQGGSRWPTTKRSGTTRMQTRVDVLLRMALISFYAAGGTLAQARAMCEAVGRAMCLRGKA
jgi:hypothetical protein